MEIKVDLKYCNQCPKHAFKFLRFDSGYVFGFHICKVNDKTINDLPTYEDNLEIPQSCPNKIK